jgi:predicted ABC-type transport system involved in lysophospholipase L1 biosynthesis ATPase subunit
MGVIFEFKDCLINYENEKIPPINLTISEGEKIAIVVARDSFDIALLHLLFFINREYEGHALYKNKEFIDLIDEEITQILRKQIHASFHLPLINNMKLIENVYLPLLYHTQITENILFEKAYEILKNLGIDYCFNKLPAFLNNHEKRCGLLARAFIYEPDLVYYSHILDDANKDNREFYLRHILDFHNKKKERITILTFRQKTHIPDNFEFDKIISLK